jgi:hypothetical protein
VPGRESLSINPGRTCAAEEGVWRGDPPIRTIAGQSHFFCRRAISKGDFLLSGIAARACVAVF